MKNRESRRQRRLRRLRKAELDEEWVKKEGKGRLRGKKEGRKWGRRGLEGGGE